MRSRSHVERPGTTTLPSNIRLYPWFQFFRSLLFWQAIWFLYFQKELSAAEAILLAAIYDISTTALEVPSGYMSDRLGRRVTLIIAVAVKILGALLLGFGDTFVVFALAQILLGASAAFASGTDTSLLYESLTREKRAHEIQTHEQRAWRFGFTGLALSAVLGGLLGAIAPMWAFLATAVAAVIALIIATRFEEPAHTTENTPARAKPTQFAAIAEAMRQPTLAWLFFLAAGMYTFSHVPFVFGQPFILEAINASKLGLDASIVSGSVVATMMLISVATSWLAPTLQKQFGVGRVFMLALAMQAGLIGCLAITNHPAAIALLFLRMVPDSLARPYILARIHPLLGDDNRATYLSVQSFCGRLLFATTLYLSSLGATAGSALAYPEIQTILSWYAAGGLLLLAGLIVTAKHAKLD
ncbi:MAG: MFS family permease [Hyphomicrobiaceae bacterium]|jgi:MFS family permease